MQLHLRQDTEQYTLSYQPDGVVQLSFTEHAAFFSSFKRHLMQSMRNDWTLKESQGRLARVHSINHALSMSHLTNLHLSDSLVIFVIKARLQLLECNTLLHTYFPTTFQKQCQRCGFFTETVSHILNSCRENKNSIQKRHNRIAEIVCRSVMEVNTNATSIADKILTPALFTSSADNAFSNITHTRPDLCVIDHANNKCLLIEVSVPFDAFVEDCYTNKFNKYLPLCQKIGELGFQCKTLVLVVGSLGSVHSRFSSGLKMAGIPAHRAKAIARYCSISAMIGSRIIWKQRCKNTNSDD